MPTLSIHNTTFAYTDQRKSQPVILTHGSARSRLQWRHIVIDLSGRHNVNTFNNFIEIWTFITCRTYTKPSEHVGALPLERFG
ncbi:MAG TPA: hypothetical protein VM532_18965 [Burkholderiales bacterium]|nr:hypothetical protein [Burkholderiales bacterium]